MSLASNRLHRRVPDEWAAPRPPVPAPWQSPRWTRAVVQLAIGLGAWVVLALALWAALAVLRALSGLQ